MKFGGWKVNPITGSMPQKVATAFDEVGEKLLGTTYEPIAYLGSQVANGTNHAVLAKQTIVSGLDQVNIVLMKFNEKDMNCSLYAIEPLLQGGGAFGGFKVDVATGDAIPEDAMKAFSDVLSGWVGASIVPIALLGTKVVKGVNYVFLCETTGVYPGAEAEVKLIVVNSVAHTVDFEDVLGAAKAMAFGAPLGEWP